jgi:hypothetical protein
MLSILLRRPYVKRDLLSLRGQVDNELFFAGFKKLVAVGAGEPVPLNYRRQASESARGTSPADVIQRWHNEPGLPDNRPALNSSGRCSSFQ